jgi:hypothetical protein
MPLNYKNRTHYARTVSEIELLLFALHYTEHAIGSFANPKTFINALKNELEKVVFENFWDKVRPDFDVRMTGYFKSGKDSFSGGRNKVDFDFSFRFDPYLDRLKMMSLKATINDDIAIGYPITTHASRDLPRAGEVAKELTALLDQQILQKIQEGKKVHKNKGKGI